MVLDMHLHLHFFIRDANADPRMWPSHPGITQWWMNCIAGGAELPAFRHVMQGACYQLKEKKIC